MRQLSPLDAAFIYGERSTSPMHICTVSHFPATVHGKPLTLSTLRSVVNERLHLLAPFRHRLIEVPFGIDHPYWVEDPEFDLGHHLYETVLPSPGDRLQLAEQVARIVAQPLDWSRPLWELHLIRGLAEDQTALVTKYHHCVVDGAAAEEIMAILLDPSPEPRVLPPAGPTWRPGPLPGPGEMLMRGLAGASVRPFAAMTARQRMMSALPRLATAGPARTAPRTPFNARLTPGRSWAFGQVPLDRVKAIGSAFCATVNDVVMTACAAALRRWLLERGALPEDPLLAMVPVSVRTERERGTFGNRVSVVVPPLPTTLPAPVERLQATQAAMGVAKAVHDAIGADVLRDLSEITPAAFAQLARTFSELLPHAPHSQAANIPISNIPGPAKPLYLAGARMLSHYPAAFLPPGMGLSLVDISYLDGLNFGLVACPDLVPDVWELMGYLLDSVDELSAAAVPA